MRTKLLWSDPQCQHSRADELPHWSWANSSGRELRGTENIIGRRAWSTVLQVTDDRFSDFKLDWKLLNSTAPCATHREHLTVPVEIAESELRYLTAS